MIIIFAFPLFLLVALLSPSALAWENNYLIINVQVDKPAIIINCRNHQQSTLCIVLHQLNWHAAFMFCRRIDAELMTIKSSEEQRNIEQTIIDSGMVWVDRFWMAGTDLHAQGEWTWMNSGRPMRPYTNWAPGEPNNAGGNEHCASAQPSRGDRTMFRWNDIPCDVRSYFVCEFESYQPDDNGTAIGQSV